MGELGPGTSGIPLLSLYPYIPLLKGVNIQRRG